eukprot:7103882-Ditylum_brightwellii.AAC.1
MSITNLYPAHAEALQKAGILLKKIPTVSNIYGYKCKLTTTTETPVEQQMDKRKIFFVIELSCFWKKAKIT